MSKVTDTKVEYIKKVKYLSRISVSKGSKKMILVVKGDVDLIKAKELAEKNV